MPIEGVDFANPRPSAAALYAAGKRFVVRYLSPNTTSNPRKRLTPSEVTDYHGAGLAICVVWETTTGRARDGHAAGVDDAQAAIAVAKSLGFPADQVIYFAVDEDTTGAAVVDYFRGVGSEIGVGRTGVYAGIRPVTYLLDNRLVAYAWQTYAWSGGRWDSRAQCQQYHNGVTVAGVSLDLDRAMTSDYGQWEADMPLSQDDIKAVAAAVWTHPSLTDVIEVGSPPAAAGNAGWYPATALAYACKQLAALGSASTLAAAIAAELGPAGSGVTEEQMQTAVTAALAKLTLVAAPAAPSGQQ